MKTRVSLKYFLSYCRLNGYVNGFSNDYNTIDIIDFWGIYYCSIKKKKNAKCLDLLKKKFIALLSLGRSLVSERLKQHISLNNQPCFVRQCLLMQTSINLLTIHLLLVLINAVEVKKLLMVHTLK